MAESHTSNVNFEECLKNLMHDLSHGLDETDSIISRKVLVLKKTIVVLIDQLVSVNGAHVDKDFLDEFLDVDVKARVEAKILNCLEEEMSKLNCIVEEQGTKNTKYKSLLARLDGFSVESPTCGSPSDKTSIILVNALELARDSLQILNHLFLKLLIATTSISFKDVSSLDQLELWSSQISNTKKRFLEKKAAVENLLSQLDEEEVKLSIIPKR